MLEIIGLVYFCRFMGRLATERKLNKTLWSLLPVGIHLTSVIGGTIVAAILVTDDMSLLVGILCAYPVSIISNIILWQVLVRKPIPEVANDDITRHLTPNDFR